MKTIKPRLQGRMSKPEIKMTGSSWRIGKTSSAARGYGSKWRTYRKHFLFDNPVCVFCLKENRVTAATVVDHIIAHEGDKNLFWVKSNHQALCKFCHDSTKQKQEKASY